METLFARVSDFGVRGGEPSDRSLGLLMLPSEALLWGRRVLRFKGERCLRVFFVFIRFGGEREEVVPVLLPLSL
eukprot:SAG31_NODE_6482_length_2001_cov_42.976190_3_plen_73_part_01